LFFNLLVLACSSFLSRSMTRLWLLGEVLGLTCMYVLVYVAKDTAPNDMIDYIFLMFYFSFILFCGIITEFELLIIFRIWRKLRLFPLHRPILNLTPKFHPISVVFFWIYPKLPYFIIVANISLLFGLISLARILILTRDSSRSELLGKIIIISSTISMFLFQTSLELRFIVFFYSTIWRFLLLCLHQGNVNENYFTIISLIILLPVPRSYSWIRKVFLTTALHQPLLLTAILIVLTIIPAYMILQYKVHEWVSYRLIHGMSHPKYVQPIFISFFFLFVISVILIVIF